MRNVVTTIEVMITEVDHLRVSATKDDSYRWQANLIHARLKTSRSHSLVELPLGLPTIEQTWGCLTTDAYKYLIPFAFSIK